MTALSRPGRLRPGLDPRRGGRPARGGRPRRSARCAAPAARRRRRRPGADLGGGPAAAHGGPRPGIDLRAASATPTARCRRSAAPTRACSPTAWTGVARRRADARCCRRHTGCREALRAVGRRVTRRIGAPRWRPGHASSRPAARPGGRVDVEAAAGARRQEAACVAAELREAHLCDGVPWSQMAVVVRGRGGPATLRRVLMSSGVPVAGRATEVPVRDEVAVRPLLALLRRRAAVGPASRPRSTREVGGRRAAARRIGGADAVGLRRLRRALRREELDAGGGRTSDELLVAALADPAFAGRRWAPRPRRRAAWRGRSRPVSRPPGTVDEDGALRWAPGVTAETVLWAMWAATGLAEPGSAIALGGGPRRAAPTATSTPSSALFDAAARSSTGCPRPARGAFLDHIRGQDVPGDTLVARAPGGRRGGAADPAGGRRAAVAARGGRRRPGGRVARPAAARLAAGLRAAGRRRRPAAATSFAGGPGGGPLRRDPAVPRRRHAGPASGCS